MRLLNAPQIREVDRRAIEDFGLPGVVLMENAGVGTTAHLLQRLPAPAPVAIFAGSGNNGGDGYVIARHLLNRGWTTWTFSCTDPAKLKGDAAINYKVLSQMTDALFPCRSMADLEPWIPRLQHAGAILDGLLGTGLSKPVSGWYLQLLKQLNAIEGPLKLAIDIPSGLDPLSGHPRPICFRADLTTTYAFAKVGLVMPDALPFVGDLEVVDIGAPSPVMEEAEYTSVLQTEAELREHWPSHGANSHKGSFGHALVLAGSRGKAGAALLSSLAVLRCGAGLCTLATEADVARSVEGRILEVMCEAWSGEVPTAPEHEAWLAGKSAVILGPGLGQSEAKAQWIAGFLQRCSQPLLLDADGLNLLASQKHLLKARTAPTVLTPHPGEMGRLTGTSSKEVQADRLHVARDFAHEHGVIVVLKGARTIIAAPEGSTWINPTGNPGLATAGSGDVLAGMIGALLARKFPPLLAARAAVYLHGATADTLAQTQGYSGIIASDLLNALPQHIASWESRLF